MTFQAVDPHIQSRLQNTLRQAQRCHAEARVYLRSHPQVAQTLLDLTYDTCLAALEQSREWRQDDGRITQVLQQWMHTQNELEPRNLGDHALALRIARERLGIHRLHERSESENPVVYLDTQKVQAALEEAFQLAGMGPPPKTLLAEWMFSLGDVQQPFCWIRPSRLGVALRTALRQGRRSELGQGQQALL